MNKISIEISPEELTLYAVNNEALYFSIILPVINNLKRKASKKVYDREKAVKAFNYASDEARKKYMQEFNCYVEKKISSLSASLILDYFTEDIFSF